jgi:hypothetical protein
MDPLAYHLATLGTVVTTMPMWMNIAVVAVMLASILGLALILASTESR